MVYSSFMESVIFFSFFISCWFGHFSHGKKRELVKIARLCCNITGVSLRNLLRLYEERLIFKAQTIVSDSLHTLHAELQLLPSVSPNPAPVFIEYLSSHPLLFLLLTGSDVMAPSSSLMFLTVRYLY